MTTLILLLVLIGGQFSHHAPIDNKCPKSTTPYGVVVCKA